MFTYTDFDCYVSQTFFIIKTERINLIFLTALLNSKLIAFWLRYRGKMQGNNYQIDKQPLLDIPICEPEIISEIIPLMDKIYSEKKIGNDILTIEDKINTIIYKMYDLTHSEIAFVTLSLDT